MQPIYLEKPKQKKESFDDGVILARLVNSAIKNPFLEKLVPTKELEAQKHIKRVYLALAGDDLDDNVLANKVTFYS